MSESRPAPGGEQPRDVDEEFARLLEAEGVRLPPGEAPREPAARDEDHHRDGSPDSPCEPPSEEERARARAAHPSGGRWSTEERSRDDAPEDDLAPDAWMGDFVPPDPDLPEPSPRALWSWTALIAGIAALLVVAVVPALPTWIGGIGGLVALGGIIALLLGAPKHRDGDGIEV